MSDDDNMKSAQAILAEAENGVMAGIDMMLERIVAVERDENGDRTGYLTIRSDDDTTHPIPRGEFARLMYCHLSEPRV